ncbi:MAG: isopenicillin N synthase family oxygenase, partial [Acidimicrobiaceae bacterium]|nr:isopenicillin N synthase family oxygenase [Acidimicrobiaceae bacterium]
MTVSAGVVSRVPLVDLSGAFEPGPRRDEAVDIIGRACEDVGFLVITGHGVDDGVVQRIDAASRRFFSLPHEEKLAYVGTTGVYRGFTPSQGSALALSRDDESLPDLCELYTINRFDDPE